MARNIMHLGVGQVVTTVLTIVLNAAVARTFGPADFGVLYLLVSIATFAYVIVDWGHGPYIIREVARRPDRTGELIGTELLARSGTAVVATAIAVSTTWLLGYDSRTCALTGALILAWLPQYLGLSFGWAFRGLERMDCDALLNVVLKVVTLGAAIVCLALGGRLVAYIMVSSLGGIVTLIVGAILYRRLGLPALSTNLVTTRELYKGGAAMLAMSLAVAVQPYFDANILFKLTTPAVAGWYGAAWTIAGTLVAPATILGATLYPRFSRVAADPSQLKDALRAAFRPLMFVAVLGAVGTYLFADVAVGLIYSSRKFGASGLILRAFAPALLLLYIDMVFGHAILAAGKAGRLAAAKIAAVAVTTGLEFVLVPWCQSRFGNGGMGTMLAMGAGEVAMVSAAFLIIREAVDLRLLLDLGRGVISGGATVVLMRLGPELPAYVGIPVCIGVFVALSRVTRLVDRADLELLALAVQRKRSSDEAAPITVAAETT
jgi:O-antigen/teichoic acid export membrane protein